MKLFEIDHALLTQWGSRILFALLILVVGFILSRILVRLLIRLLRRTVSDEALLHFIQSVLNALLLVVVIAASLDQLGVDTTSLLAVLGAAGLAVGLAMKDSLQNVASGVLIIALRPFRAGDYIDAAGVGGTVEKVGLFNTCLLTPDNREVLLPNSSVVGATLTNYSARDTRRIDLTFGIAYSDSIPAAKQVLQQVLAAETRILPDPEVLIVVGELGDNSVNLYVRPWVKSSDYWAVRFALLEQVKLAFDAAGISIPFPQRDVHLYRCET
jgi:small conductance mechanosensitive channel